MYKYREADKFVAINEDDDDLYTVNITLPPCPKPEEIDGYGLEPKKQKFCYQEMPDKLKEIKNTIRKKRVGAEKKQPVTIDDIYKEIEDNETHYRYEIEWIKKQQHRHYYGYWFYSNGKPTYITGAHYTYLNWWPIGAKTPYLLMKKLGRSGMPEYRDRDRKWFTAVYYASTTKDGFFKYEVVYNDGNGLQRKYCNSKSKLEELCKVHRNSSYTEGEFIVEMPHRTLYGIIYPKHRREGATSRAAFLNWYMTATQGMNRFGGIQSLSDTHAKSVFLNHLAKRYARVPFFLRLISDSASIPKNELSFSRPASKASGFSGSDDEMPTHDGVIDFRPSGDRSYDGEKLHFIHLDEVGKKDSKAGINVDNIMRWSVVMKCLAQGPSIHGFGLLTSTLGEMTSGGGDEMKHMIKSAMFNERDDNGMTANGLWAIFFPAYDGLDEFVDEYGMSVVEPPTKPCYSSSGAKIIDGSKSFLENRRRNLQAKGDDRQLINEMQDFPFSLKECFMGSAKNSVFPIIEIRRRIAELSLGVWTQRGRFEWVKGVKYSDVEWVEDPEGPYKVSFFPQSDKRNRRYMKDHIVKGNPHVHPHFESANKLTLGVDLARYSDKEVSGKRKSYFAMSLYYSHDEAIDKTDGPYPTPIHNWVSENFILTCKVREDMDKTKFCEEALKVCIYFGAMCYPEMNVPDIYDRFVEWGHAGYLKYDVKDDGTIAKLPGYHVSDGAANTTKQDVFQRWESFLRDRVQYVKHSDILEECRDIEYDMGKFDLFASGAAALKGAAGNYLKQIQEYEESYTFDEPLFREYNYAV